MGNIKLVTGIRPTGELHLGNYYGALKNLIGLQANYDCYFFIADIHSLTTHPKPESLKQNVPGIAKDYLAAGLDPNRCAFYAQSSIAFNQLYGELFPEPNPLQEDGERVPALNGQGKMSKSDNADSYISLQDDNSTIHSKVKKAFSDPQRVYKNDPGHPTVEGCNVFHLHTYFSDTEMLTDIAVNCQKASIGCVECKARLARSLVDLVEPFRERRAALADEDVLEVLTQGRRKAAASAQQVITEVRRAIGVQMY